MDLVSILLRRKSSAVFESLEFLLYSPRSLRQGVSLVCVISETEADFLSRTPGFSRWKASASRDRSYAQLPGSGDVVKDGFIQRGARKPSFVRLMGGDQVDPRGPMMDPDLQEDQTWTPRASRSVETAKLVRAEIPEPVSRNPSRHRSGAVKSTTGHLSHDAEKAKAESSAQSTRAAIIHISELLLQSDDCFSHPGPPR
jgi:hypothetical protein